jgi:anti-sigma factor RsiW
MNCKEIFERLGDYIDQEIDPELCAEIESHIEGCEPCVAFINTLRKTVELFHGLGEQDAAAVVPEEVSANLKRFLAESVDQINATKP